MDVLRNRRHSEQQKIEKELFPQCIQAPIKYFNKRKSLNIPQKKRDRKSILFPGEATSVTNQEMDSSKKYVEQWLMQQVKDNPTEIRQPFSTLNVNIPRPKHKTRSIKQSNNKSENNTKKKIKNEFESRKRKYDVKSSFKSQYTDTALTSVEKVNKLGWDSKKIKLDFGDKEACLNELQKEHNIKKYIETIVIKQTQSEVIDKDKLAFKAVQEADDRENHIESEVKLQCSEIINYTDIENTISKQCPTFVESDKIQRVPFFKKDILLENCRYCNEYMKNESNHLNDLTITVESKGFTTTINLSDSIHNNHTLLEKHSVLIQTDICGINYMKTNELSLAKQSSVLESKCTSEADALILERNNLSLDGIKNFKQELCKSQYTLVEKVLIDSKENPKTTEKKVKDNKPLIIEESDSDIENTERSSKHSELMFGVLTEMERHVYKHRTRNKIRRRTPTSTDSSDKENRDPNRIKLQKFSKKINKKK